MPVRFPYPPGIQWRLKVSLLAIVRSRDKSILDNCDIIVDVGGIYDHNSQRYDHHQRDFTGVFGHGFETKLSSAGLIYK